MESMDKIWGCQTWLEQSFEQWEDVVCIFQVRGDSMLIVDSGGRRVMNEKAAYDKRVRVHWEGGRQAVDNAEGENAQGGQGPPYPQEFLFLIGDQRCVDTFGANFAKTWPADPKHPYYITGSSIEELTENIRQRLVKIAPKLKSSSSLSLDDGFTAALNETIDRFNGYARAGVDDEFGRGDAPSERQWSTYPTSPNPNDLPNPTMYPLDTAGTLYCLILAPSLIDTKGGPVISTDAQVLRRDGGNAISGLYGAGNAAAPISGDAYWSGGATLGTAMVSGWVAGNHAANSAEKELN